MRKKDPSNSSGKRGRRRRVADDSEVIETPGKDGGGRRLNADTMTEGSKTSLSDTHSQRVDWTPVTAGCSGCSPETRFVAPFGTSEGPQSHCSVTETALCPSDGKCALSNRVSRTYALRSRRKLLQRPSLSSEVLDENRRPDPVQDATNEAVTYYDPHLVESREETFTTSRDEPLQYCRKDSGVFAGRLKANPLRHLAALLRSKLLFHGNFRNLLELANEIHLEAKEKHNTTLRRIYDVVNVTEAAGLLERAVISRSGRKKPPKGSPLSGSLIRWCSPPTTDAKTTEIMTIVHNRIVQKEKEFKDLEEEVKLLENLIKHRKARLATATSPVVASNLTSAETHTRLSEHVLESTSNQPLYSSTPFGIQIPFCLLKASRRSDDRSFEVYTYTDECGSQFQVAISSDDEIQPYEWRWILREMLKSWSFSTLSNEKIDELLMKSCPAQLLLNP